MSVKKYIDKKLNEGVLTTALALPIVFDVARQQGGVAVGSMVNKISSIYNQNKYSKKDCADIMDPEERLKCEIYTKIKIANIRLKQLYSLKKTIKNNQDMEVLDRYIQKDQNLILKLKSELLQI